MKRGVNKETARRWKKIQALEVQRPIRNKDYPFKVGNLIHPKLGPIILIVFDFQGNDMMGFVYGNFFDFRFFVWGELVNHFFGVTPVAKDGVSNCRISLK